MILLSLIPLRSGSFQRNSCASLDSAAITLWMRKLILDMDLFAFIHALDPTKVKIVEQKRVRDEPLLLQTIVGRTIPLFPVTPDHADSKMETSIDKLFDEGGIGSKAPRRQRKRKTIVAENDGSSHPPKKLREDHGTPSRPPIAGKSRSVVQRLLTRAVLNVEVRGDPIPTLPFVTSSVSATLKREGGDHTDSVTAQYLNYQCSVKVRYFFRLFSPFWCAEAEVDSLVKSTVPVMTVVTTITPTVDPTVVVKEKTGKPSVFAADSFSAGGADPNAGVFSRSYQNITNGSHLNDDRICREMVDEFAPLKFFASIQGMKHDQLFTKFNIVAARQMSLSAEVRMRAEYNIREKMMLKSSVDEKDELLKSRDKEIENLKAQMVLKEADAAEAIRLCAEASNFMNVEKSIRDEVNALNGRNIIEKNALDVKVADLEASTVHELKVASFVLQEKLSSYENLTERLEEFQDAQLKVVNDKFNKLHTDFVEMALHLKERFYPHILTTISGRRWLLTHGMELAISKCLKSSEHLSALRTAIGKVIEKGMQDGLSARITHGMEGRALTDVPAYNPSAKANYISALQRLQSVNFSLFAELRSNKDASIDIVMNILRLEETLAERLVGATSLSFSMVVLMSGSGRLERISQVKGQLLVGHALITLLIFQARRSGFPSRSLNLYAPFPSASVTSYGPSHLGPSSLVSFAQLASLLRYTRSTSAVLSVGMPISARMIAFALLLIFQVRGSGFPSRSLNLYAPFPSASVTLYGPSHLGPSSLVSFACLASLLRYTRSTSAVLSVGMPISAGMIAFPLYVNENGVSPLLDFIIVRFVDLAVLACSYKRSCVFMHGRPVITQLYSMSHGWRQLVSTKYVTGWEDGSSVDLGLGQ
nr:transposase (putative), gypsy type [Tanacetum cinerariifolium]